MERKIILASRSPRRKQILKQIGLQFETKESEYEEDMRAKNNPYELVQFLALNKARDVARHHNNAIVIGADTIVVLDDKIIGKPKNKKEAKELLRSFSGREHKVVSGFAIIDTKNNSEIVDYGEAVLKFKDLSDEEIDGYIECGDPFDVVGGYNMIARAPIFLEGIKGDFYSIIGLPLNKVYVELRKMGVKFF
jgi:septum formation protein